MSLILGNTITFFMTPVNKLGSSRSTTLSLIISNIDLGAVKRDVDIKPAVAWASPTVTSNASQTILDLSIVSSGSHFPDGNVAVVYQVLNPRHYGPTTDDTGSNPV